MQGKVEVIVTDKLNTVVMDTSKKEFIKYIKELGYGYRETPRTITVKDSDKHNIAYFIFSDDYSRIILADLVRTELYEVCIDGIRYEIEELKKSTEFKRETMIKCSILNKRVKLDNNGRCACTSDVPREMCRGAGQISREIHTGKSIITYMELASTDVIDNSMFCVENNDGLYVQYRKIQKEDREVLKSAGTNKWYNIIV